MSFTKIEFKREAVIDGITQAIKIAAIRSGEVWYCEDEDGTVTDVIFGRADIIRGQFDEVGVGLRLFDRAMFSVDESIIGSAIVCTEINNAERAAVVGGDGDLILRKLIAAANAAAPRLASIAMTAIEGGV